MKLTLDSSFFSKCSRIIWFVEWFGWKLSLISFINSFINKLFSFCCFTSSFCPRSIRRGRKRPFLIVFDSFGSDRITVVFYRIVNERKRPDTPFSGRLRQLLTVYDTTKNGRNHCPGAAWWVRSGWFVYLQMVMMILLMVLLFMMRSKTWKYSVQTSLSLREEPCKHKLSVCLIDCMSAPHWLIEEWGKDITRMFCIRVHRRVIGVEELESDISF
jgi:hypothetical protein